MNRAQSRDALLCGTCKPMDVMNINPPISSMVFLQVATPKGGSPVNLDHVHRPLAQPFTHLRLMTASLSTS